jgi:hypothetical protein
MRVFVFAVLCVKHKQTDEKQNTKIQTNSKHTANKQTENKYKKSKKQRTNNTATCKMNGNRTDGVPVVNWNKSAVENL